MVINDIGQKELFNFFKGTSAIGALIVVLFVFIKGFSLPVFSLLMLIATSYLVAQFSIAPFFMLLVLVIPFAVNQQLFDSQVSLLMPSEPLEAIITLAFIIKILSGYKVSSRLLTHPVFWLMFVCLAFQFVAVLTSAIPVVSIKTMCLKTAYFIVFFILSADLYLKQQITHVKVLKTYAFSLSVIGIIIFFKHLGYGLSKDVSGTVTEPFYADHTIYSACLTFILPLPLLVFFNTKSLALNFYRKFWIGVLNIVLLVFLFFTYCRAGWISFVIASLTSFAIYSGLRFKGLMLSILFSVLILVVFQSQLIEGIKQNKADSNAKNASLEQQTKSVTNITSDQSNAERLNRWSCAWRMFLDKPFLGYGPGTYQFEYLTYQKKSEMTRISVTSPFNIKKGKGGTAHSEYLLLLSETGLFSFLCYILSIIITIYYAIKVYAQTENSNTKIKILIVFFGFCTYILHAFFNNFLDTDKAALLYYTSIAAILAEAVQLKKTTGEKLFGRQRHERN